MPVLVDVVVFDGVDELDVVGPLEVLRRAAAIGADVQARLCSRTAVSWVSGSFGMRFQPDTEFKPGDADVVIVPGGGWVARSDAGAWAEVRRGQWLPLLSEAAGSGSVMAGVCTGVLLLAHAGVIGARRATTHHDARADLAAMGATVIAQRVVDEGTVVTSAISGKAWPGSSPRASSTPGRAPPQGCRSRTEEALVEARRSPRPGAMPARFGATCS